MTKPRVILIAVFRRERAGRIFLKTGVARFAARRKVFSSWLIFSQSVAVQRLICRLDKRLRLHRFAGCANAYPVHEEELINGMSRERKYFLHP